jgi:hypothetical protein
MVYDPGVRLWGRPVCSLGGQAADGRDVTFWHLGTDSTKTPYRRTLSAARVSLIGRVWDILESVDAGEPGVTWWSEIRQDGSRSLLAAPVDLSLVVILRRRRSTFRLVTAYPCNWQHLKQKIDAAREAGGLLPTLPPLRLQYPDRRSGPLSGRARRWYDASFN